MLLFIILSVFSRKMPKRTNKSTTAASEVASKRTKVTRKSSRPTEQATTASKRAPAKPATRRQKSAKAKNTVNAGEERSTHQVAAVAVVESPDTEPPADDTQLQQRRVVNSTSPTEPPADEAQSQRPSAANYAPTLQPGSAAVSSDPSLILASALEKLLNTMRATSMNEESLRLLNRMTTAKSLPTFAGNQSEWLNFKEVYYHTTELGAYTERDNIARLFESLTGEARSLVSNLLATNRDPEAVMQTLELHYGNKNRLAQRVAREIYDLPRLDSKRLTISQFATKIRNAVATFKTYGLTGHLHNPDLFREVGDKIPSALRYEYTRYLEENDEASKGELEKMSDFLNVQATRASKTVLFEDDTRVRSSNDRRDKGHRTEGHRRKGGVYSVESSASHSDPRENKSSFPFRCKICNKGRHPHEDCRELKQESKELCLGCLKPYHYVRTCCSKEKCPNCNCYHHNMLSCPEKREGNKRNEGARVNCISANTSASNKKIGRASCRERV